MALITYDDKQAMGTQPTIPDVNKVTDSDMNQIKNVINNMEPTYCVATTTTASTVGSNTYVNLNLIAGKSGDFSLDNGGVKIPAGINHIRVSGSIFVENWPGSTNFLWGKIYRVRGGTEGVISTSINGTTATYLSASMPASIIDVQENDIIKLMADATGSCKLGAYTQNTWLCIEKIN